MISLALILNGMASLYKAGFSFKNGVGIKTRSIGFDEKKQV